MSDNNQIDAAFSHGTEISLQGITLRKSLKYQVSVSKNSV